MTAAMAIGQSSPRSSAWAASQRCLVHSGRSRFTSRHKLDSGMPRRWSTFVMSLTKRASAERLGDGKRGSGCRHAVERLPPLEQRQRPRPLPRLLPQRASLSPSPRLPTADSPARSRFRLGFVPAYPSHQNRPAKCSTKSATRNDESIFAVPPRLQFGDATGEIPVGQFASDTREKEMFHDRQVPDLRLRLASSFPDFGCRCRKSLHSNKFRKQWSLVHLKPQVIEN